MSYIDGLVADRLGGADFGKADVAYKFEAIKRAKAAAALARPDVSVIDLGVGEGDRPAEASIVAALAAEAGTRENRRYADNGIDEFRDAAGRYLQRVYGVNGLDPRTEILHGIGSKPILALLPAAFINPGDVLLTTVPCYPVAANWTRWLGGEVWGLPLLKENGFLPDLDAIPRDVLRRAKLLYLNYPNNPTGACADAAFFERVVDFAERNRIAVIHDAAYAALVYGHRQPLSFLAVPGAAEVGVETHSLSKAYDMTGWRMGFVAGNAKMVAAYGAIKDNSDAGQFRAVQKAAVVALENPEITRRIVRIYERRFVLLVRALRSAGFDAEASGGSFYCYVRAPAAARSANGTAPVEFPNAAAFSDWLLRTALVSTVPWDEAGAYVRCSVTFEAETPEREAEIMRELERRLARLRLEF
jgi:LL-diaminopimelate aminotransferase